MQQLADAIYSLGSCCCGYEVVAFACDGAQSLLGCMEVTILVLHKKTHNIYSEDPQRRAYLIKTRLALDDYMAKKYFL